MAKLLMPPDLLNKLNCSVCNCYLSVFPVHIKTDGENPICGRCRLPNEHEYIRDEAYEGLAQFLVFPCAEEKNGCTEQMTPVKLKDHEQCCVSRKLDCPSKNFSRCNWKGPNKELKAHFETSHDKLLLLSDRRFEINFLSSVKETLLMPVNDDLFLIKKETDSRAGTFICSCTHIILNEKPEHFNYFVRVETSNGTYYHKYPERSTSPNWEERTKFSLEEIKDLLHDPPAIVGVIEVVKTGSREEEPLATKTEVKSPEVDWDALRILECPVCFDYVLPPIFQCINGHSICSGCKPKLQKCPICKAEIGATKNFALEQFVGRMIYPCKYHKLGCPIALKSTEISRHEDCCEYGPYDCPVAEIEDCRTQYTKSEIIGHVENNHNGYVLKTDKINLPFAECEEDIDKCYLIKFSNRLFKVCFKFSDDSFYWALLLIGPAEECKQFRFEIDIIDNSDKKLRQYARGPCVPMTKEGDVFAKKGTYIRFLYDQISDFIVENLSYRVRVLKE